MNCFQKNFDFLINNLDVTQKGIELQTGIKQTTLSNWLQGKGEPRASDLVALNQYFGISIDLMVCYDIEKGNLIEIIKENFEGQKGNVIGYPSGHPIDKNGGLYAVPRLPDDKEENIMWAILQEQRRNSEKLDRALVLLESEAKTTPNNQP